MDPLQDETFQLKIDDAWKQELQETPEVLFVPSAPPTVSTDFLPIESAITTTGTLNVTELNTGTSLDVSEISINDDQQQQAEGAPGNVEDEIPRVTVVNNPKCCDLAACLKGKNYLLDIEAEIPISRQSSPAIVIHNAGKGVSGSGKTIIIYDIKTMVTGQIIESKHRYSDFEGLREIFLSSYNCVVPPIPSKHSVADYASKPGKAKLDVTIIAKRKRMLQTFLLRAASDPILQGSHAFHLFLTDQSPWNTVMKQHLGTIKRPPAVRISSERTLQRPGNRT